MEGLGLWEILAGPGVKAVEWSERLPFAIPEAIHLEIRVLDDRESRRIELTGIDVLRMGPGESETKSSEQD